MDESIQIKVVSLLNTFFQELMDYKFKETYDVDWFQDQLLPFITGYVNGKKVDGDLNYDKYRDFLKKNYGNPRVQDIDVTFACAILLFEKRYNFQYSNKLFNLLDSLRDYRNKYQHAAGYTEYEWFSLHSRSIDDLKNAASLIGRNIFGKKFWDEIESVEKSISSGFKPGGGEITKGPEKKSVLEQEYTKAQELFSLKNYSDAYAIHIELAMCGYARSASRIAEFYQFGYGVDQNFDTAIEWHDKAKDMEAEQDNDTASRLKKLKKSMEEAENGDAISQLKLGMAYEEGKDTAADIEKASEWYEKSMHQGIVSAKNRMLELAKFDDPSSWYLLGIYYEDGTIFTKDIDKAIEQYKKVLESQGSIDIRQKAWDRIAHLANQNNAGAQFELARYFEAGAVVKQDYSRAFKWYEKASELGHEKARGCIDNARIKAAENGDAEAQFKLGRMYAEGDPRLKNYEKAAYWYKKSAEQGHGEAEYSLAVMYEAGLGVDKDHVEAVLLYKSAAGHGNTDAQYEIAREYEVGLRIGKDLNEAFKWYKIAAEQGHEDAGLALGRMYAQGIGTEPDAMEAVRWYKKTAEHGNCAALYMLGMMYEKGLGVEQDYGEALKWYLKSAEAGNKDAQYKLGTMYEDGLGVNQDYAESANYYKKAAESGHMDAQFKLGMMFEKGRGVEQDYIEGAVWYKRAADQEHSEAQFRLGVFYEKGLLVTKDNKRSGGIYANGLLVAQDYKMAESWYRKAAANGCEKAKSYIEIISMKASVQGGNSELANELGQIYENGLGVEQDYAEGAEWYLKGARRGYKDAQYNIGRMYENGWGVKQDYKEAAKWYIKAAVRGHDEAKSHFDAISRAAAELGDTDAQHNLGTMYEEGRGVLQDYAEASAWYLKAANQGNEASRLSLGNMYENGLGVKQDYIEAKTWYEKAACQGNFKAELCLGRMYEEGLGVKQDYIEAKKWYEDAANHGSVEAKEHLFTIYKKAAENGDVKAKNNLGRMYAEGKYVKQDYSEAARWYKEAAGYQEADDEYYLGVMYENALGVAFDYDEAVKWYNMAIEHRYTKAQINLGRMYDDGKGVEQNFVKAAALYFSVSRNNKEAQDNLKALFIKVSGPGYENIQYSIGQMYEKSIGEDSKEALRWYERAAQNGHGQAQYMLGEFGEKKGTSAAYEAAISWYKKAADQGVLEAQYKLGSMYYSGFRPEKNKPQLVEQDYNEAFKWYYKAAQQGHADAQYKLARMYEAGKGVGQDYNEAAKWCENAAIQGHTDATENLRYIFGSAADKGNVKYQYRLGLMFENGQYAEKDLRLALVFYKKAAENGHAEAQYKVGTAYEYGRQVEMNIKEAVKWYHSAAKSGHEASSEAYKRLRWKGFFKFGQ